MDIKEIDIQVDNISHQDIFPFNVAFWRLIISKAQHQAYYKEPN
jgi:hypothetical protein